MYDSELRVLEVIWAQEGISAKDIAKTLNSKICWSRTTTYTMIKRCIEKGYIRREDNFACYSLITKKEVQQIKVRDTLSSLFDNSLLNFFSAFTDTHKISQEDKEQLRKMIDGLK